MSRKIIRPEKLSMHYSVKKLCMDDVETIYTFCSSHTIFYRYCGKKLTRELIENDLQITPPGIELDDKFYVGFYKEDELIAIMDLINGYPAEDVAFIGFFMISSKFEGCGIGSSILIETFDYLKQQGFTSCRLGIDRDNPQSNHFWKKNGFETEQEVMRNHGSILLAARQL